METPSLSPKLQQLLDDLSPYERHTLGKYLLKEYPGCDEAVHIYMCEVCQVKDAETIGMGGDINFELCANCDNEVCEGCLKKHFNMTIDECEHGGMKWYCQTHRT